MSLPGARGLWAVLLLAAASALLLPSCTRLAPGGPPAGPDGEPPPRLLELGGHHRAITTRSALAQRYFDQGLILTYGFNHDAAVRAFAYAEHLDPACASCAWGVALALGPNINWPMGPEAARRAHAAVARARALSPGASPVEQALIEALSARYAGDPPTDRAALDRAYAEAMQSVQRRFPADVDVAVLTAEALMDLTPWDYWTGDARPREHTREVLALLEWAMARDPEHVGANHYYIHATEEHFPERAEAAADRLAPVAPDAGHLVHMPSHIYWRVGRYEDALEINRRAAAADEAFFATCRSGAVYRSLYYPHNIHFLWAAAATEGRSQLALSSARKLAVQVRPALDEMPFVEEFLAVPLVTLVRFGRWDAVLGEPRPDDARAYWLGIWHYARGLALLRTGDAPGARAELAALRRQATAPEAEALVVAGGTAPAARLLAIGVAHLEGELLHASGQTSRAVQALEQAVSQQDALVYMEPPPWFFPTRQALGAVLLDSGRAGEAEEVYRRDLEQHPRNAWSLYGLARSLEAQGRTPEARWAMEGHRKAFARADVVLGSSRF